MSWLQFWASVIGSIAWPAAFVGSIWLFRKKIIELMPRLRLKYRDWEGSFRLDQAEKEAAALPPPAPNDEVLHPTKEEKDKFKEIAEISPRAAMLEVRTDIEEAVRSLAKSKDLLTPKVQSVLGLTRLLRSRGVIDEQTSALLDDLRVVGNNAAHNNDADFTMDEALRYRATADRAIAQLRASMNQQSSS